MGTGTLSPRARGRVGGTHRPGGERLVGEQPGQHGRQGRVLRGQEAEPRGGDTPGDGGGHGHRPPMQWRWHSLPPPPPAAPTRPAPWLLRGSAHAGSCRKRGENGDKIIRGWVSGGNVPKWGDSAPIKRTGRGWGVPRVSPWCWVARRGRVRTSVSLWGLWCPFGVSGFPFGVFVVPLGTLVSPLPPWRGSGGRKRGALRQPPTPC